ncbi:MAG: SCO family protein [Pseudomonadota bacterium]
MTAGKLAASLPRFALAGAAAAAFAVGALGYVWLTRPGIESQAQKFESVDITGVDWGKGFELTDFNGRPRTLADFRGKVVLLFFGYANCPDMCPATLAKLGDAVRMLGADADRVQGLFVTVDPKRDTPQVLSQYVPAFHPAFLGLYGTQEQTASAAKEFKVYFQLQKPNQAGFYTVDHSGPVFVLDRGGRLRLFVAAEKGAEALAHDLRILLKEAA